MELPCLKEMDSTKPDFVVVVVDGKYVIRESCPKSSIFFLDIVHWKEGDIPCRAVVIDCCIH